MHSQCCYTTCCVDYTRNRFEDIIDSNIIARLQTKINVRRRERIIIFLVIISSSWKGTRRAERTEIEWLRLRWGVVREAVTGWRKRGWNRTPTTNYVRIHSRFRWKILCAPSEVFPRRRPLSRAGLAAAAPNTYTRTMEKLETSAAVATSHLTKHTHTHTLTQQLGSRQ